MWKQLDLMTGLINDDTNETISTSRRPSAIVLQLRHSHNNQPSMSSYHKLAPDALAADIRPPSGVSTVGLTNIAIDVDLELAHNSHTNSAKGNNSTHFDPSSKGKCELFNNEMLFETTQHFEE